MSTAGATLRATLGEGAVLTVGEAVRALGWRGARAWLDREDLVVTVEGRRRVVWRQVLAKLEGGADRPARNARLRIAKL